MKVVEPGDDEAGPFWRRLAWFFVIALAAGAGTALAAYALKALLR